MTDATPIDALTWRTRLGLTVDERLSAPGGLTRWTWRGPIGADPTALALSTALLTPLIIDTLPGYGDGRVAARCLCEAERGFLWVRGRDAVGFSTARVFDIDGRRCAYVGLSAITPALQGQRIIGGFFDELMHLERPALIAVTTNVPAGYRSIERLCAAHTGAVVHLCPAIGEQRPPAGIEALARAILSTALGLDPSVIRLDEWLVRRGYRARDLQQQPMPAWLASHQTGRVAVIARFFADVLRLEVGDAAFVLADLVGDVLPGVPAPGDALNASK